MKTLVEKSAKKGRFQSYIARVTIVTTLLLFVTVLQLLPLLLIRGDYD